jgi:anti-repressor protein
MNEMKIFEHEAFGQIRTTVIHDEPWFVGKDVAEALGYTDTNQAIRKHVDDEDKLSRRFDGSGQRREMTIINESGLYSLVLSSKLPTAKQFKRWVTSVVLPSIRKTGGYLSGQEDMSDDELIAKALDVAHRRIAEKEKQIEAMRPKAIFADAVATSKHSILVGEMAKILKQNGVEGMGQNRFFIWLRENHYLIEGKRSDRNMPTQRSIELGLFEIKETAITHSDGHVTVSKTPKITGKGQTYFVNKFLGGAQ